MTLEASPGLEEAAGCLIVDGVRCRVPVQPPLLNFECEDVLRLDGRPRTRKVDEIIVHESVTRSAATTLAVLRKRRLGIHLIIDAAGLVTQHGDLYRDRMSHAGPHNARSIGIEVVNPYYPKYLRPGLPWRETIAAPWAHKNRYVLPTPAQAEALASVLTCLTEESWPRVAVPRQWIGLDEQRMAMGRFAGAEKARPGIYAHHYFAHSDGAWLVLYAWLRLEAGLGPEDAYAAAVQSARDARRSVNLSRFLTQG